MSFERRQGFLGADVKLEIDRREMFKTRERITWPSHKKIVEIDSVFVMCLQK